MYWDIQKVKDRDCLFNFIIGARGVGKTYGCKNEVIKEYLKRGKQFVYLRRYKEELKKVKNFFSDVSERYPDYEFKADRGYFYIRPVSDEEKNKNPWEVMGYYISLSTAKIEKSTAFPLVDAIIFDEFILDKGYHRYLPDEVTNFLEAYSTIARLRDVRVYFLSNALTITNPYFIYFNINMPYRTEFKMQDDILIQYVMESEYQEEAKKTRFAKIIEGTPYADYSIENEFLRDDRNFVMKKTLKSRCIFGFVYKDDTFGVWYDYSIGYMFVSKDYDKSKGILYSFTLDDHKPNTVLLKGKKGILLETFIKNYKLGLVRFESINIKNICNEIIKLTL